MDVLGRVPAAGFSRGFAAAICGRSTSADGRARRRNGLGRGNSGPWNPACGPANRGVPRGVRAAAGKENSKDGAAKRRRRPQKKAENVWASDFADADGKRKPSGRSSKSPPPQQSGSAAESARGRGAPAVESAPDGRRRRRAREPSRAAGEAQGKEVAEDAYLRFLSPVLPIEEEILLQPEETVVHPQWTTFCSSASGVWRGVGAAFSPVTGDFEPISLDKNGQYVYDTRVLNTVEALRTSDDGHVLLPEQQCMHRTILWSAENPLPEHVEDEETARNNSPDNGAEVSSFVLQDGDESDMGYLEDDEGESEGDDAEDSKWEYVLAEPGDVDERWANGEELEVMDEFEVMDDEDEEDGAEWAAEVLDGEWDGADESDINFNGADQISRDNGKLSTSNVSGGPSQATDLPLGTTWTNVMEEDDLTWESGLAFFEDGAYSRGPLELSTVASASGHGNLDTFACKIEQCLVVGGHTRLRVVHTVSIEGGEKVEVLRVAVYEEEWMGPCNMKSISDVGGHQLKLLTERARHHPGEIVGSWKVFNVEAMAMHPSKSASNQTAYFLFSCKETAIKRGHPVVLNPTTEDDGSIDMSAFSMSWLPGNVSTYVSVNESNGLTFGMGWMCDNRTRLVMERVYDEDGKLVHVNSKSEIKMAGSK